MTYDLKAFGERLSEIIEKRYIQRTQLAQYCGIHRSQITAYCSGKRRPTPQHLITMCIRLDCSPEWLKNGKGTIDDRFDYGKHITFQPPKKFRLEKEGNSTLFMMLFSKQEFNQFREEILNYSKI